MSLRLVNVNEILKTDHCTTGVQSKMSDSRTIMELVPFAETSASDR